MSDDFPTPTDKERYIMAYISMVLGMIGMAINTYMFRIFLSRCKSEFGFYKFCLSKTVSNWLMCASYVFYLVPFMFNAGNFLPFYIRMIPEQMVGYVAYLMGPLIQLYLAVNRCLAIFTPLLYKQNHFQTVLLIIVSWISTIILSVILVQNHCEFGLHEKSYSWGLTNEACNPGFASLFFSLIVILSATSNLMNIPCGIKFFKDSRSRAVSLNISRNQRLRAKKLIMQCIIQDWLPVFDMVNNLYTYTLFFSFIWTFLCCSISMLFIHVIDGFVMSFFNRKKEPAVSSIQAASASSKVVG